MTMADMGELLDRLGRAYGGGGLALSPDQQAAISSSIEVIVSDVSDRGARLSGHDLPEQDTPISLRADELVVEARVAWSIGTACGIEFRDLLFPAQLAKLQRRAIKGQLSAL
jgi:hypothetical protein